MRHIVVLFGNITFHHFEEYEEKLFLRNTEQRALIHSIEKVHVAYSEEQVNDLIDNEGYESYLVPQQFNGEIVIESMPMVDIYDLIKIF